MSGGFPTRIIGGIQVKNFRGVTAKIYAKILEGFSEGIIYKIHKKKLWRLRRKSFLINIKQQFLENSNQKSLKKILVESHLIFLEKAEHKFSGELPLKYLNESIGKAQK